MYEEPIKEAKSLGERIYELLCSYSPAEQKTALREAEERVHKDFEARLAQIKKEEEEVSKQWETFKNA